MDDTVFKKIIQAGIAAPSADNSQPWLYTQEDNTLKLYIDESRSGGISDARFVLSDLAIGAVIENMSLQAQALGYKTDVSLLPDEQTPYHAATLSFQHTDVIDTPLCSAISERHTDRTFPWKGPITSGSKNLLSNEASVISDTKLIWMDGAKTKSRALSIIRKAESMRFRYQELHQELFSSIDWRAGWKGSCKEGLPPAALAVEPPVRPVFKALRNWALMRLLNRLGGAWQMGLRAAYLPVKLSPGLCLLVVKRLDRAGIIESGRALERVWLRATTENLVVQPFAAAGIYAQGHIHINEQFINEADEIRSELNLLTGEYHGIIFLRLGYKSGKSAHRSSRRPQESFYPNN